MTSTNDIRSAFLDYFGDNEHEVVASAPLVPLNDPTLMFVNAGMVPFKNVFTGAEKRDYVRAVTSQKCVRAGGKHNDLDNVGYTARHHTFFEMLGNFSFGDYFKERAVELAWTLLTKEFSLPADKLLVTVFHEDDEAFDLWRRISGLSDDRIIRIATSDNFWSMGDTGPCGPCSEIFYDHGGQIEGGPPGSSNEDGDRFVEIWNLVFMQFDQHSGADRIALPKPSIDTGMGLERIAAVLQGTHDNYKIDLMQRLISASADATGAAIDGPHKVSHRVVADHLRACAFLMADGVLPSNEGRGYVLRRIMRRAMRHIHMMGSQDTVMYRLVPTLVSEMGAAFPELVRAEALITETLRLEEERFQKLLERGLKLLAEETSELGDGEALAGEVAFKLYDTYGFPLDLTQDALRSEGRIVEQAGFDHAMAKQKAEARAAWAGSGDAATDRIWFNIHEESGATEFLGYASDETEGSIVAIVRDGERITEAQKGDQIELVVNQTPFYAESGGQMGDAGTISGDGGLEAFVSDTQKKLGMLHVHSVKIASGGIEIGDQIRLWIDTDRRARLRANHSATHVLHEALRRELGDHVTQKGSLVAPDRLRFDISHPKAISADELWRIENNVNEVIRQNRAVNTRLMTPDEAVEEGALALFGEKYGDEVRVVSMGNDDENSKGTYSVELCGGTHVNRLGDIGLFHIVSESAVAAGVRRIEALTGAEAHSGLRESESRLAETAALLRISPADVPARVGALATEVRRMEKELAEAKKQAALGGDASAGPEIKAVSGLSYLPQHLDGVSPKDLRGIADDAKNRLGSGIVAVVTVNEGKAAIVVGVTDDLTETWNAVDLVRVGAEALGGKGGGGRPDMAQAGGPDGGNAKSALDAIEVALGG